MNKNSKIVILGFILSLPIIISFQNCSKTQSFALSDLESLNKADAEDQLQALPAETQPDQVAIQIDDTVEDRIADRADDPAEDRAGDRLVPREEKHEEKHVAQHEEKREEKHEERVVANTPAVPSVAAPPKPEAEVVVLDNIETDIYRKMCKELKLGNLKPLLINKGSSISKKDTENRENRENKKDKKDKKVFSISSLNKVSDVSTEISILGQGKGKSNIQLVDKYKNCNKNEKMLICYADVDGLDDIQGDIIIVGGNVLHISKTKKFKGNLIVVDGDINGVIGDETEGKIDVRNGHIKNQPAHPDKLIINESPN